MKKDIYSILRGTFLVSDDSFKNWKMILFISGLAIIMIASSHSADKKVYEIARLKEEVKELRSALFDGFYNSAKEDNCKTTKLSSQIGSRRKKHIKPIVFYCRMYVHLWRFGGF